MRTSFILLLCCLNYYCSAQNDVAYSANNQIELSAQLDSKNIDNWTIRKGRKGKALFVDLGLLKGISTSLKFMNEQEQIIHQDKHLFDLPVNTIYELDLENLKRGVYFVVIERQNDVPVFHKITI